MASKNPKQNKNMSKTKTKFVKFSRVQELTGEKRVGMVMGISDYPGYVDVQFDGMNGEVPVEEGTIQVVKLLKKSIKSKTEKNQENVAAFTFPTGKWIDSLEKASNKEKKIPDSEKRIHEPQVQQDLQEATAHAVANPVSDTYAVHPDFGLVRIVDEVTSKLDKKRWFEICTKQGERTDVPLQLLRPLTKEEAAGKAEVLARAKKYRKLGNGRKEIPENEKWLHAPQAQQDLQEAMAHAVANPVSNPEFKTGMFVALKQTPDLLLGKIIRIHRNGGEGGELAEVENATAYSYWNTSHLVEFKPEVSTFQGDDQVDQLDDPSLPETGSILDSVVLKPESVKFESLPLLAQFRDKSEGDQYLKVGNSTAIHTEIIHLHGEVGTEVEFEVGKQGKQRFKKSTKVFPVK